MDKKKDFFPSFFFFLFSFSLPLFETSRFAFAQSLYFSPRASKSNLDGAQEPEHAPDFSPRVLDISASNII